MEVLTMIGIGIDTHKATLAVSAVDELGRDSTGPPSATIDAVTPS